MYALPSRKPRVTQGDKMDTHEDFSGLGIAPQVRELLRKIKFHKPTPIQAQSIPSAIEGQDIMGIAQTGTGKTMAFGIPMVQRLINSKGTGLVIVPTRELAIQVEESLQQLTKALQLRTALIIGGAPIGRQIKLLQNRPRIIIGTPGRLIDLMEKRKIRMSDITMLVLDEADRMFDMGFAPQIHQILEAASKREQTSLFSATMPAGIMSMAQKHLSLPLQIEIAPSGTRSENITHELFVVRSDQKKILLNKILESHRGSVLLFCRTKRGATTVARELRASNITAIEMHSDRSLDQRKKALQGFKTGRFRVLVATDVAARGIDVDNLELVINYDLPDDVENYVHRIGRTGRAGAEGHAITFASPDERARVVSIERLIKETLPVSEHPDVPAAKFLKPQTRSFSSRRRGGGGFRRRR